MKLILSLLSLSFASSVVLANQTKFTKEQYVEKWKDIAIGEMVKSNIPASITLAQGILESGNGNSALATQGNNHFGIKCHGWTGDKMFVDDDAKGECFRVYPDAGQSYEDHSLFLTTRSRYAKLFELEKSDYKGWAKGLKAAGYATNPKYPELLINLIEGLKLYDYDAQVVPTQLDVPEIVKIDESHRKVEQNQVVYNHQNKVKFVLVKEGDTFYKLATKYNLSMRQLRKYNDFSSRQDLLRLGEVVYLQPKKNHISSKVKILKITEETTLRKLACKEAIYLKVLLKKNSQLTADELIKVGTEVKI
jgi:LysM repeat protein